MAGGLVQDRDGGAAYVLDMRHTSVTITTWFGELTEPLIRRYFDQWTPYIERLVAEKRPYVVISDSSRSARPSPKVRKLMTDLIDQSPAPGHLYLGTFVVLESALVRGALTAMQWLSSRDWKMTPVPTMRAAIERAREAFAAAGVPAPSNLSPDTYQPPRNPAG